MAALEDQVGRAVVELEARQAAYERATHELETAADNLDRALARLIKFTDQLLHEKRAEQ